MQKDTSNTVIAISLIGYNHDYGTTKKKDKLVLTYTDSGLVVNNSLIFKKISGSKNHFKATNGTEEFIIIIESHNRYLMCKDGTSVKPEIMISIEHANPSDAIIRKTIYWCNRNRGT